jgi:hypothetical protein
MQYLAGGKLTTYLSYGLGTMQYLLAQRNVPFEEEHEIYNICSPFMTVPTTNILRIPTLRHSFRHGVREWNGQCNGSSIIV